jgi:hypothetical protein
MLLRQQLANSKRFDGVDVIIPLPLNEKRLLSEVTIKLQQL